MSTDSARRELNRRLPCRPKMPPWEDFRLAGNSLGSNHSNALSAKRPGSRVKLVVSGEGDKTRKFRSTSVTPKVDTPVNSSWKSGCGQIPFDCIDPSLAARSTNNHKDKVIATLNGRNKTKPLFGQRSRPTDLAAINRPNEPRRNGSSAA